MKKITTFPEFVEFCQENNLSCSKTTPKKKTHKSGGWVLVEDGETEVLFRKTIPRRSEVPLYLDIVNDYLSGKSSEDKIDGVTHFPEWVEQAIVSPVPVDQALKDTQSLGIRELFKRASGIGYDGITEKGNVSFNKRVSTAIPSTILEDPELE